MLSSLQRPWRRRRRDLPCPLRRTFMHPSNRSTRRDGPVRRPRRNRRLLHTRSRLLSMKALVCAVALLGIGTLLILTPDSLYTIARAASSTYSGSLTASDGGTTDTLTTAEASANRNSNTTLDMGSNTLSAIVVDRTDNVTTAGTGNCTAAANDCTLRGAINVANSNADISTITFDATVFAGAQIITITNGLPLITTSMSIAGPGEALLTLSSSGGATRLFQIEPGTTVSLIAMTLSGSSTNSGGALFNNGGTLTVSHVTCSGNTALNTSAGGALYNSGGALTVDYATFTGNTAGGSGGAIHSQSGSVFVSNSTFTNNTSNATNSATGGGAIYSNSGSSLRVFNSSFVGNNVPNGGYGGALFAANSPLVVTNSTFSGNTAPGGGGGGISSINPSAVVTITNSTFSGNGAATGLGGGIRRGSNSPVTLRNTIIANSTSGGDWSDVSTPPTFAD